MKDFKETIFKLSYKPMDGVSALWFEFADSLWIVDPCVLFNGMLGNANDSYTAMLYTDTNNFSHRSPSYWVSQDFNEDYFFWTIRQLPGEPICRMRFAYKDFLHKVELACYHLYKDTAANLPTAYDGIIQPEEIKKIFEQIKVLKLFAMPGLTRSSEVDCEKLTFKCPLVRKGDDSWAYDIPYTLKIGNREITSCITDCSNDMDFIRHQLESYCYCRKAQIELHFEDEPMVISLRQLRTLASAKTDGSGIVYRYDDYVKVEIQPDSFAKGSAIIGICNEEDTIRELYEGLLNIGRRGYEFKEYGQDNPWDYEAIVFYNHIKSPIIERYLSGIMEKYNSIVERQKIIHHVFTICPDYTHVLGYMTGQSSVVGVFSDDVVTLYKDDVKDEELCSVKLSGIYEWLDEFNRYSDGVNSTMGKMNVKDWHHRGLILAKELKKKLPEDIDVWYSFPFEDVDNRNRRPVLITEGTLKDYFEEELGKACLRKDKDRIDYCLYMNADINANDGAALKHLIASEIRIDSITSERLADINDEKLELFEHLLSKGLIINACKGGIDPLLELCRKWKCDKIEKRIHKIMNRY